jgi:hypothetical protein
MNWQRAHVVMVEMEKANEDNFRNHHQKKRRTHEKYAAVHLHFFA